MTTVNEQTCGLCLKTSSDRGKRVHHCARCLHTFYCSRECQRADWKSHKPMCARPGSSSTTIPTPSLDIDGQSVTVKGHDIPLTIIKTWIHSLVERATAILFDELLFCPSAVLSRLSLEGLVDELHNYQSGYSFLTNPNNFSSLERFRIDPVRNLEAQPGGDLMVNYANIELDCLADLQHIDRRKMKKTLTWMAAGAYYESAKGFLKLLLVLVLMTGGLPPYEDDLLSIQAKNSEECVRGISLAKGAIVITTLDDDPVERQLALRFMPSEVGAMIVLYLQNVLPLTPWKESCFLFTGPTLQPWSRERYSEIIKNETLNGLGVGLEIGDVRTMILQISRANFKGRLTKDGYVR